ncbi:MAG: zinc ribbon domain-containing protein [Muribaculaceae bacterium]|nr:zinc ribbon domain-containing protein [Muribaculaceae bacterium]
MSIKCPNCGNTLPDDSAFCNRCGSRIEMKENNYRRDYEDWSDDDRPRGRDRDDRGGYNQGKSNRITTYVVIGILVLAFLAIFAINKLYFSGNNNKEEAQPVSIVDNSNSAAADALSRALNENNYVGDGATIVYAMRIAGSEPGTNDKIIGITQLSNKGDDSFYKLYELTQNGEKWNIDPEHIKQVSTSGREISFDQNKLKAGIDMIPQAPEIGGKKYFFYAYLSIPKGEINNRASVVLNLYDVESRNITSATYEGQFENINGEQSILCNPASGSSETVKWMNEQARNFIRILSLKTGDERAEQKENKPEEQKAQPEQTAPREEARSEEASSEQSATPAASSAVGEEKDKDTPMFSKDDIVETKQAGNYKVFRLKDGSVVRYDRSTGKNTKIHQGGAEAIGFEDTEKGILNIRKADGSREQVNLNNGQKSSAPAKAAAPAKAEEPKKTE